MRGITVLVIAITLLVCACGYGTVGHAGNVPEVPDDTAQEWLSDLLTTAVGEKGEPLDPEVVLADTSSGHGTEAVVDGGPAIADATFETDERVTTLINELTATIEVGGDLRPLISERGLYLAYNTGPVLYSHDDLDGILSDETTRQWPSHLIAADDPAAADLPYRTFAEEIGGSLLEAFNDPANQSLRNEWTNLDEKGIPEEANPIPVELRQFDTVSISYSGHNGIEWFIWYVMVDYEDGGPVIAGLAFNGWTP